MIDIYIFSKPLQYLNIKNLVSKKINNTDELIIIGNFFNAKLYYNKIKEYDSYWNSITFFESRRSAYISLINKKIRFLYLDRDHGIDYFFLKFLSFEKLRVYEEGYGTYRPTQKVDGFRSQFKEFIVNLFGSGRGIGQSPLCSQLIVYYPNFYAKENNQLGYTAELVNFDSSFEENLLKNRILFDKIFSTDSYIKSIKNKKVFFYATTWTIDYTIIQTIVSQMRNGDIFIIKPHPHIKEHLDFDSSDIYILNTPNLLEFILIELKSNNNDITVYHQNSTSMAYLQSINSINIPTSNLVQNEDYSRFYNFLRENE
ncbi:hypothetical protein [Flammeovirga sp. EKP202]|uniref:hypothetical protein n=1 Tax=Flammeovirga sp. EKP202 TaxID=2770592 RepID=UPI00165F5328|nr:hypothetical protein [Flammeovirga sp. EKP202]MBD0399847.1 hypothetical protein [Flammeovirga sp. EKP202]